MGANSFREDEDRDFHGRWTAGGAGSGGEAKSKDAGALKPEGPVATPEQVAQAQAEADKVANGEKPIEGLPQKPIVLPNGSVYIPGPNGNLRSLASEYMKKAGLEYNPVKEYHALDVQKATDIAKAFDEMKSDPNDPKVKASYAALAKEVIAQWGVLEKSGIKVDWLKPGQADPYAANPRLAAVDADQNKHWWGFPTDAGYGSGDKGTNLKDNPMLQKVPGLKIGGREVVVNDVFRVVHDMFGHFKEGNGFRAAGEDNAWRSHASMFSAEALPAMTAETRGQNSWVNYGPYGETNRKAKAGDTHYAPQKIGLMPKWAQE